jgi:O-antigen/teichoic acid export membrane protein
MASDADAHRLVMRGGGAAAFGYLIRLGARLFFLLLAARLFGAALFGAYSLAIAAVELAVAIGGLGMKRYLFRLLEEQEHGRAPAHVVADAALAVALVSALFAAGLAALALSLPPHLLAPNTALALAVAAPMVIGQALLDLLLAASRWLKTMRVEVAARSLVEPYAAIAALAAAALVGFDQAGLAISYWAGTLVALLYAALAVRRRFGVAPEQYRPSWTRLKAVIGEAALPAATDLINALFGRLDLYLVGGLLGEAPAGIYNMARQIRTPIRQVRQSFDGMLTPVLARTLAARGAQQSGLASASATRLMLAIQLPMLIALVAIGQPLLDWLGPEFGAAYWPMVILAGAETILAAFGVGDLILLYRRPGLGMSVMALNIAVTIGATLLLIGPMGLDGAALAMLIAVASSALLRRLLLSRAFGVVVPIGHGAGPMLAAVPAAALTVLIMSFAPLADPWRDLAAAVTGLALYGVALRLWLRTTGQRLTLEHLEAE